MTTLSVDMSNFTSPLATWHDGLGHVIVQAVNPPAPYPARSCRNNSQLSTGIGLGRSNHNRLLGASQPAADIASVNQAKK